MMTYIQGAVFLFFVLSLASCQDRKPNTINKRSIITAWDNPIFYDVFHHDDSDSTLMERFMARLDYPTYEEPNSNPSTFKLPLMDYDDDNVAPLKYISQQNGIPIQQLSNHVFKMVQKQEPVPSFYYKLVFPTPENWFNLRVVKIHNDDSNDINYGVHNSVTDSIPKEVTTTPSQSNPTISSQTTSGTSGLPDTYYSPDINGWESNSTASLQPSTESSRPRDSFFSENKTVPVNDSTSSQPNAETSAPPDYLVSGVVNGSKSNSTTSFQTTNGKSGLPNFNFSQNINQPETLPPYIEIINQLNPELESKKSNTTTVDGYTIENVNISKAVQGAVNITMPTDKPVENINQSTTVFDTVRDTESLKQSTLDSSTVLYKVQGLEGKNQLKQANNTVQPNNIKEYVSTYIPNPENTLPTSTDNDNQQKVVEFVSPFISVGRQPNKNNKELQGIDIKHSNGSIEYLSPLLFLSPISNSNNKNSLEPNDTTILYVSNNLPTKKNANKIQSNEGNLFVSNILLPKPIASNATSTESGNITPVTVSLKTKNSTPLKNVTNPMETHRDIVVINLPPTSVMNSINKSLPYTYSDQMDIMRNNTPETLKIIVNATSLPDELKSLMRYVIDILQSPTQQVNRNFSEQTEAVTNYTDIIGLRTLNDSINKSRTAKSAIQKTNQEMNNSVAHVKKITAPTVATGIISKDKPTPIISAQTPIQNQNSSLRDSTSSLISSNLRGGNKSRSTRSVENIGRANFLYRKIPKELAKLYPTPNNFPKKRSNYITIYRSETEFSKKFVRGLEQDDASDGQVKYLENLFSNDLPPNREANRMYVEHKK